MTEPLVTLQNLEKRYGHRMAIHDVSLQLYPGEAVALVGMSGGGKSTIMRLIAGLEKPTGGRLTYQDPAPVMRVMYQDDRLLPWLTVQDNVGFGQHGQWVTDLLAAVGLSEAAEQYPAQLSGGQRQRLALARALLAKPQLLLLDEPLGALDALTRRKMQDLIMRICAERHLSSLLITHDVQEAARMADWIIVVKDGTNVYQTAGAKGQEAATVAKVGEDVLRVILDEQVRA
ncbi:ATP-binding cassette domain-containing protein [Schleiferilactobacillus harbinensis]|jgi:sulfonate transport system ATP-binding protein|uniref:ATP-binding cassette domain-containing protein n=2 Tax=Schleiferilactobacillus harbinensis TaxID=304207 RepID=A0A510TUX9_9LACO|nr:ATP-binding cassette domain-containing protein [Schleiferilactobacillus harbinensis]HAY53388.1 sulfonate ABC transporter ATP-binding protein [Lactobacillus sp.]KRM29731.1 ABC-type aliphatic sulfonate transport system, ATP-binding component [Schleiferilactobacillus harbinensis DSM 16991]MCI1686442.1 ATP-binding cassette domain-containing protein [Schleiferilactobacillus harbinensis]MCI1782897.1 ATP-binding cassette domain-containing protein [Schleiferilactobacillus harbinensis]MCI1850872.1 A